MTLLALAGVGLMGNKVCCGLPTLLTQSSGFLAKGSGANDLGIDAKVGQ